MLLLLCWRENLRGLYVHEEVMLRSLLVFWQTETEKEAAEADRGKHSGRKEAARLHLAAVAVCCTQPMLLTPLTHKTKHTSDSLQ